MSGRYNGNNDKADLLVNEIVEKITDHTYTLRDKYGNVTNERVIDEIDLCGDSQLRKEIKYIINNYMTF